MLVPSRERDTASDRAGSGRSERVSVEPLDGVWLYADAPVGRSGLHPLAGRFGGVGVLVDSEREGLAGLGIAQMEAGDKPGRAASVSRSSLTFGSSSFAGMELKVARRASIAPSLFANAK